MTDTSLDGPHWQFATRLYGQPGVASACLELQDSAGVDVIVLLFMLYSVRHGAGCDAALIAAADAVVADWRATAILPLRAIRKALKAGNAMTPAAEAAELRKSVQAAEIRAEQISLAMLARNLGTGDAVVPPTQRRPLTEVVEEVARFYAATGTRGPDALQQRSVREAIESLARAAEAPALTPASAPRSHPP